MKLIIGLGNPGLKYEVTRHNIGFVITDFASEYLKIKLKPGKGQWIEGQGTINSEDVYLLKPMDYMNNSGTAVLDFIQKKKIDLNLNDILVILDDFQIPLGTIRIRKKGSDGGHNGLSDIIYHLNSVEFPRMRVGIGKNELIKKEEYIDFVLGNFQKEEIEVIKKLKPVFNNCIMSFINDGLVNTMNKYNKNYLSDSSVNTSDNLKQ